MERKILKEKVRRLRAWILVIVTAVSCLHGNVAVEALAATNSISIGYYSDGEAITSETDAKITSTDHSAAVEYEDASPGTATLPTATRTGYVFVEWDMGDSGGNLLTDVNGDYYAYSAGEATFSTGALTAASTEGMIYLYAQWRPENQINITYSSNYGTLDTASVTYGESTNCTDGAAAVTLPTVTDTGDARTFIGWKCYAADSSGNKTSAQEITTLVGYSTDIAAAYENITVGGYAAETQLSIPYPTDTANAGGNIAYYIFEAQFVEKKSISYMFSDSDTEAQISSTGYAESVDCYGTTAEKVTLPSATKENTLFVEWSIADSGGNLLTDSSGNTYTYPAGEATFSAEALQAASSYDASMIYLVGTFADAGSITESITVSYDAAGGSKVAESPVTVYKENADDTTVTFTLAGAPTRDGYTFLGWKSSVDADSTACYSAGTEVTYELTVREITFTAQWKTAECTVNLTYDAGGGAITSTNYIRAISVWQLENNVTIAIVPVAEKAGYFFTGWTCETKGVRFVANGKVTEGATGSLIWDGKAKDATEITLKANYVEIDSLTVNYDANGGENTVTSPVTVYQATVNNSYVEIVIADAPARDGYTFLGWKDSRAADGTALLEPGTGIAVELSAESITLIAQWEIIESTQVPAEPEIQIISGGIVSLQAGEAYCLSEGKWKVNGDSTIYEGGNEFYVPEDGDYEFIKVGED